MVNVILYPLFQVYIVRVEVLNAVSHLESHLSIALLHAVSGLTLTLEPSGTSNIYIQERQPLSAAAHVEQGSGVEFLWTVDGPENVTTRMDVTGLSCSANFTDLEPGRVIVELLFSYYTQCSYIHLSTHYSNSLKYAFACFRKLHNIRDS